MNLVAFSELYAMQHDSSQGHADQLRWCVNAFSKFLGRDAALADLSPDTVNRWLFDMKKAGLSATTRSSRRRMLLTLAAEAARQHRIEPVARELVARVKAVKKIPDGLSRDEAQQVVSRLQNPHRAFRTWLSHTYRTGIDRGPWWVAFIMATWDTGAPADLRRLKWSDILPDGRVVLLRSKTQKQLDWQLSQATLQALADIRQPERELVFPLPGRLEVFRREARYVIQTIGGVPKSLGGFRSGAGTDAEITHGAGAGCKLLGNTPQVFVAHYAIPKLLPKVVVAPRPLKIKRVEE